MAYNQYSSYGGNPYESAGGNPYESEQAVGTPPTSSDALMLTNRQTPYNDSQQPNYPPADSYPPQGGHPGGQPGGQPNVQYVSAAPSVLANQDFLQRVEAIKADIRTLSSNISQVANQHQQQLSSPDRGSAGLEGIVTQTQVLNTSIRDQIRFLEADTARDAQNKIKDTQIKQLKTSFQKQLQQYQQEEASYRQRTREQLARQYRIVNPDATEAEVAEASQADWNDEGIFQIALKTNRSATANTVLGAVRARHNDIQHIEKTMTELQQLMEDLATVVVLQDQPIQQAEQHTDNVKQVSLLKAISIMNAVTDPSVGHRSWQRATRSGHQIRTKSTQAQVVVPRYQCANCVYHCACAWLVFWPE